jgi:hypothetical protein
MSTEKCFNFSQNRIAKQVTNVFLQSVRQDFVDLEYEMNRILYSVENKINNMFLLLAGSHNTAIPTVWLASCI